MNFSKARVKEEQKTIYNINLSSAYKPISAKLGFPMDYGTCVMCLNLLYY